jgi:3-methyladenine DNA glycosylase Tag
MCHERLWSAASEAPDGFQETKEMVAGMLKSGVRVVSQGIDAAADAVSGLVPDSIEKSTVCLRAPLSYV